MLRQYISFLRFHEQQTKTGYSVRHKFHGWKISRFQAYWHPTKLTRYMLLCVCIKCSLRLNLHGQGEGTCCWAVWESDVHPLCRTCSCGPNLTKTGLTDHTRSAPISLSVHKHPQVVNLGMTHLVWSGSLVHEVTQFFLMLACQCTYIPARKRL